MGDIRRRIIYQAMGQPPGQDITVTFADGTTFTARYCGSGVQRINDTADGEPCTYITLHMLTAIGAETDDPEGGPAT